MKELTTILPPRQHELEARLDPAWQPETEAPVVGAGTLVYEMGKKVRAIAAGGIGLVEQLVDAIGLRARLDERVQVFTRHRPYHESDHILTMAYNVLTGGRGLKRVSGRRVDAGRASPPVRGRGLKRGRHVVKPRILNVDFDVPAPGL